MGRTRKKFVFEALVRFYTRWRQNILDNWLVNESGAKTTGRKGYADRPHPKSHVLVHFLYGRSYAIPCLHAITVSIITDNEGNLMFLV